MGSRITQRRAEQYPFFSFPSPRGALDVCEVIISNGFELEIGMGLNEP
jgi:hypothetical protein